MYVALVVRWFERYRKEGMIAADIGFLNQEILAEAKARPERLLHSVQMLFKHL